MIDAQALIGRRFQESWSDDLLISSASRLTYGDVWNAARYYASTWAASGVHPGDSVALVLSNDVSFPCLYLACVIGGFIAVPISPELNADDIAFILDITKPRLTIKTPPVLPDSSNDGFSGRINPGPTDVAAIFFTSGTTGRPKGVRHRLDSLVGNVISFNRAMGLGREMRMFHVLPMAYMAGFLNTLLSPMMAGGQVILGPRFSPISALDFWTPAADQGANTLWISPTIGATLCRVVRDQERARHAVSKFRNIFCGTAPLHSAVRRQFHEIFGVALQESYGTSELLLVSAQDRDSADRLDEDVGTPLAEMNLSFRADRDGRRELFVNSPFSMAGYLTEEGTISPAAEDGSLPTGDIAELRAGVLHITGRIKDLIIRGGVNVAPRTIENALGNIPGVKDVAVVGEPHAFWGEAIVVCLEADAGADRQSITAAVQQRCRDRLSRSHQPDRIVVLDVFPRAVSGKIQKHLIQCGQSA